MPRRVGIFADWFYCDDSIYVSQSEIHHYITLKCNGAGSLWPYAACSLMGVRLFLKSLLIPMSNQCLANMSLIWNKRPSMGAFVF